MATAVHRGLGLARPGWRSELHIAWAVFTSRLRIVARYRGTFLLESLLPILMAALPILLGVAVAGGDAAAQRNFADHTGTSNYKLYMLIGADVFTVVTIMLWVVAYWIRREMESGTLEALYLTPAKRFSLVTGVASYAFLRALIAFVIGLLLGAPLLGINPFQGQVLLAMMFMLVGLLPVWGLSFLFGALIMRVKEANSVVNLLQWVVSFAMGVFFPVTALPPVLRWATMAFPPTWMTHDVRASILDLSYFLQVWYRDLAVLLVFALAVPLLGYWAFATMERRIKAREGVGQF